jgi:hypothetical protein
MRLWLLLLLLSLSGIGCTNTRSSGPTPDEQFGHRFDGEAPDGRVTVTLTPADTAQAYFYFPAVVDTLIIRPAGFTDGTEAVAVEALVKGALPDACMELHRMQQERAGNLITVALEMRRPQGAICASVLRPYRFYLSLEGTYAPGPYTLRLNDRPWPFQVHAARP